ncbi:MAG TPA: hypothetical protein VLC95_05315 [Anaerolineae bacterium]|nr:hypothetical protein [Anaerolineae bacterium]
MKRSRSVTRLFQGLRPRDARARGRRRFYHERIEALRRADSSRDGFYDYLFLFAELQDGNLINELRTTFRREWAPQMRRELGRHLRAGDWATARRRIEEMHWEWQEGVGERAPVAIAAMIEHLEHHSGPPCRETIREIADGFQAVGLEATGPVVQWLATSGPGDGRVAEFLFSHAGASGRYLVRRWAERDRAVEAWLSRWEAFSRPSWPPAGGPCVFWPGERGESPIAQQGVARLALDFNPFGPEKAEQDPLLPDLFYRLWPVWQEVTTPRPSLLVAPPGSGRSALIWMMRYESELAGSALDRCLAAYAPLHVPLEMPLLAQHLARAIYVALICFLARFPDALLGLDEAGQVGLGAFLLQVSGGLPPLLADLERAGQRTGEPDTRLLHEALDRVGDRKRPGAGSTDAMGSSYSLAAVRALLRDAFTDRELAAFCQDRPALRPVLVDFGPRFSFADMIDALVSYALRRNQLEALLAEISSYNPGQFARYGPLLARMDTVAAEPGAIDSIRVSRPRGIDYIYLLVDVSFQDQADVASVLDCLFERWLPALAPQQIVPKVFVSGCPPPCPVAPVAIDWSRDALYELLGQRLERAGLVRHEGQPLLNAWVDGVDNAGQVLVEAAGGVPERLIRLGNRLIARLGQPAPLGRQEFLDLLIHQ